MFNRKIEIKLVKDNKKSTTDNTPVAEPIDYVAVAEEAADRLLKKLLIGTIVVVVSTVAVATLGHIAENLADHAIHN